ncbi:MAG: EamA family transporter, partial [Clostridia bacterium]|nr:EamA family transporter [Clostridia bacterium]
ITKQKIQFSTIRKELPLLLFSGGAMGVNWILLFEAYKYTTVSSATLVYYFAPVIVTIVCPFLFKEKLGIKQIICFCMATIGIVLMTGSGDLSAGNNHVLGFVFAFGAAVLYATVVLINKFIKNIGGIHRTLLQFASAIIVLLPYVLTTSGISFDGMTSTGWINLLIVGFIHTGVTYCMYFTALRDISGQKAAILSYVDPLVAVIISVFILSESMTMMQIAGGLLILGFTLWNELPSKR